MRFGSLLTLCSALLLAPSVPAVASPHVRRGPTAPRINHHGAKASAHFSASHVSIAPERAAQIQTALIKAGYLTGTPSGTWDAQSQAAMEKLQSDNGWQTKTVPDSRAIIKLGLGPNNTTAATSTGLSGAPTQNPETSPLFAGDTAASHPSNE
jgi:hypothetical protein